MAPRRRLSCQTQLQGDVVIDVPPDSQVHKQVVRKRAEVRAIELDPVVRLHYVEVKEPDMRAPQGDLQRLLQALGSQWGWASSPAICAACRACRRRFARAVGRSRSRCTRPTGSSPCGRASTTAPTVFAIDVGSTTIAAHLCDLSSGEVLASSGLMNPQIRFGEDLMSRVSYVMMNPGGEIEMTRAVREAIGALIEQVAAQARSSRATSWS